MACILYSVNDASLNKAVSTQWLDEWLSWLPQIEVNLNLIILLLIDWSVSYHPKWLKIDTWKEKIQMYLMNKAATIEI